MAEAQSELLNFIIDLDDGDCPDVGLHVAAFQGKTETLRLQLQAPNIVHLINSRVRPFLASPLRLAATGMSCVHCVVFPSLFTTTLVLILPTRSELLTVELCYPVILAIHPSVVSD